MQHMSGEAALATTFDFLAFPMSGASRGRATPWCGSRRRRIVLRARSRQSISNAAACGTGRCASSTNDLCQMLKGHFAYFGISGNLSASRA